MRKVLQTRTFANGKKKLHKNQIKELDNAIREILENPEGGEQKKGDLQGVYVYNSTFAPVIEQLTCRNNRDILKNTGRK